jgi:hypothetical protein
MKIRFTPAQSFLHRSYSRFLTPDLSVRIQAACISRQNISLPVDERQVKIVLFAVTAGLLVELCCVDQGVAPYNLLIKE